MAPIRPLLLLATALLGAGATAETRPFDGLVLPFKEVVVSSPVQSTIVDIDVKEGDRVVTGQLLAHLYARLEELDMERAKADLEKKAFDDKSSKKLFADKVISADEALKDKIDMESASLAYDMTAETFNERTIRAPISGIVVEKLREVGETVTPAEPMFRLVDIGKVYVQFYIRAEDLPLIHVHDSMKVRCRVLDPDRTWVGTVDFVDPRVDAASGLLRVKVLVANPDGFIRAGVRAEVSLAAAAP